MSSEQPSPPTNAGITSDLPKTPTATKKQPELSPYSPISSPSLSPPSCPNHNDRAPFCSAYHQLYAEFSDEPRDSYPLSPPSQLHSDGDVEMGNGQSKSARVLPTIHADHSAAPSQKSANDDPSPTLVQSPLVHSPARSDSPHAKLRMQIQRLSENAGDKQFVFDYEGERRNVREMALIQRAREPTNWKRRCIDEDLAQETKLFAKVKDMMPHDDAKNDEKVIDDEDAFPSVPPNAFPIPPILPSKPSLLPPPPPPPTMPAAIAPYSYLRPRTYGGVVRSLATLLNGHTLVPNTAASSSSSLPSMTTTTTTNSIITNATYVHPPTTPMSPPPSSSADKREDNEESQRFYGASTGVTSGVGSAIGGAASAVRRVPDDVDDGFHE